MTYPDSQAEEQESINAQAEYETSQRPDAEGVDEDRIKTIIFNVITKSPPGQVSMLFSERNALMRDIYEAIRPYLRAKPDAGLAQTFTRGELEELATEIRKAAYPSRPFTANESELCAKAALNYFIARQHTCAGAGKGVVDAERLIEIVKEALDAAPVYVTKDGTWLNLRPDADRKKGGAMFKIEEPEAEAIRSFGEKINKAKAAIAALAQGKVSA